MCPDILIPQEIKNPALSSLTNAIMLCKDFDEVFELLKNMAIKQERIQGQKSLLLREQS